MNLSSGLRRVIVIGASNVTMSFPLLVNSIMQSLAGPVQIFAVQGHGRSFCQWSYVLHRGLPPVTECGLWDALTVHPPAERIWGLVTDVGNDLIYGVDVETLVTKVQDVFHQLSRIHADLTYVRLPVERILMLTDFRYRIVKKLLFPGPTVPWKIISQRVVELDERVSRLARDAGGTVITPRLEWYGQDPIHIRPAKRLSAWQEILDTWPFPDVPKTTWPSSHRSVQLWRTAPARRSYWNRSFQTIQPCWRMTADKTLWQY